MAAKKTIGSIDVGATLSKARLLLKEEQGMSPALHALMEVMIALISLMANQLNLNSRNSSKPPSTDPHRPRKPGSSTGRRRGGQPGHIGTTLRQVKEPDVVKFLPVDRKQLPQGEYQVVGVEKRQVFDIDISRVVTEFQAEILEDADGNRFVAEFPDNVHGPVQYGSRLKAHAVYLSQYQLLPYDRVAEYFVDQLGIPISAGSLRNFNAKAYNQLEPFETAAKQGLAAAELAHADETGVNIDGVRHWLHVLSNDLWVYFYPHAKRGQDAMREMGILLMFCGILVHDHWKPYYAISNKILHALCNAHHLRELTCAWEQDGQRWAKEMMALLIDLNKEVKGAGGALLPDKCAEWRVRYRNILKKAEVECPPPNPDEHRGKRGRQKRSKSRNLLERMVAFEDDVLRFMAVDFVPFTNNRGENDLRMTKVQQKISGCFRSMDGAKTFCRIRGYLLTCQRRGISASDALTMVFDGKLPDFIGNNADAAE
ncbi:MAG: IS66 family transposase [Mariprofundales bacterium]